jgi:hypothetical protein
MLLKKVEKRRAKAIYYGGLILASSNKSKGVLENYKE